MDTSWSGGRAYGTLRSVLFVVLAWSACRSAAAPYTVIDLHGAGALESRGLAAADGRQFGVQGSDHYHVTMWSGSAGSAVDMNPSFAVSSFVYGAAGTQQVGFGVSGTGIAEKQFAVLWQGSRASAVSLHPSTGYTSSFALATDGSRQVGYALPEGGRERAVMWSGTAASMVDLTPPGFWTARAQGFLGEYVVGNARASQSDSTHAVLLNRPDNGVTDLGPAGSHVEAAGGGQAVGWLGSGRAYVWTSPDASSVDLQPAGALWSYALATNGRQQVGYVVDARSNRAALWSGTAESYVDLSALLPPGFSNSQAMGIDADGNIIGYATTADQSFPHAIMWAVPEPGAAGLGMLAACVVLTRRSKRRGGSQLKMRLRGSSCG